MSLNHKKKKRERKKHRIQRVPDNCTMVEWELSFSSRPIWISSNLIDKTLIRIGLMHIKIERASGRDRRRKGNIFLSIKLREKTGEGGAERKRPVKEEDKERGRE